MIFIDRSCRNVLTSLAGMQVKCADRYVRCSCVYRMGRMARPLRTGFGAGLEGGFLGCLRGCKQKTLIITIFD